MSPLKLYTDLKSEIEAVTKDFMGRFASGDMKHLSEVYTEDCRFMPSGQDTIFGREGKTIDPQTLDKSALTRVSLSCTGVAEYFNKLYQSGVTKLNVITEEVGPFGTVDTEVFERTHFTFYKTDGSVFVDGK